MNPEPSTPFDADVVIIGGGPVGLLLANLLGMRDVKTLVVEQRTTPPQGSMAIGITPPSLEILRRLELDEVFSREGVPVRHAEVHEAGSRLGRLDFGVIDSAYQFFLSIPQRRTIEILEQNLKKYGSVAVCRGFRFLSLEQQPSEVTIRLRPLSAEAEGSAANATEWGEPRSAELNSAVSQVCNLHDATPVQEGPDQSNGQPNAIRRYGRVQLCATDKSRSPNSEAFVVRSRFLVGCDGARSPAREAAGLAIRQKQYRQRFVMADFPDRSGLGNEARLYFSPEASVESFPLPGGQRRWIALANDQAEQSSLEYLTSSVQRLAGHSLAGAEPTFLSAFGARRMEAESYFRGRVALAGDSAHVMSSIGGQGMNTGFADAEMLAEVLSHALLDESSLPEGLAVYDRVRRRACRAAADRAERGMWLGTARGRVASWLRRILIRNILFGSFLEPRLAPHFAMLTIPFRNLTHVPGDWLSRAGNSQHT